MELLFERSRKGHHMDLFPPCDVAVRDMDIPLRQKAPHLPELDEVELDRHYGQLENRHLA